ncbi:MAG TPA: DUF4383 domain-containing protein [Pseudomonadales bacterium]
MAIRYFALIYGIVFIVVGIAGFVPGLLTPFEPHHPQLAVDGSAGLLFGLFPVNVLHNLVHLVFGVWGIVAWRSLPRSRFYGQAVAVVYAVFTVMGLIPVLNTTFGLVPLHGHDVWLHLLLAAVAGYFGFVAKPEEAVGPTATGVH